MLRSGRAGLESNCGFTKEGNQKRRIGPQ